MHPVIVLLVGPFIYFAIGWPIAKYAMKKRWQDDSVLVKWLMGQGPCNSEKEEAVTSFKMLWGFWLLAAFLYGWEKISIWGDKEIHKRLQKS